MMYFFLVIFSAQEGSNLGMNCSVKTMSECHSFICCRNWKLYSHQSRRLKEEEDKIVFLIKICILPKACDTTLPLLRVSVWGKASLWKFSFCHWSVQYFSICAWFKIWFQFCRVSKPSHLLLHILCKQMYTSSVESWVSWVGHPS